MAQNNNFDFMGSFDLGLDGFDFGLGSLDLFGISSEPEEMEQEESEATIEVEEE